MKRARLMVAKLNKADLNGANLEGADLGGANLLGANLKGAIYENDIPIMINTKYFNVVKCKQYIQIGCQKHTKEIWLSFSDAELLKMSSNTLLFREKYGKLIFD